jgi:hypothetical protein
MIWTKQDSLVRNGKKCGALGGIRTPDTWFRSSSSGLTTGHIESLHT